MASRLFGRQTRERVWMLYAWCRACDDLVDGQDHGGTLGDQTDLPARLALAQRLTHAALAGEATGNAAFDCLGQVARETGLTVAMADAVLEGFALDAADWQPRDEADLMRYCWHVAGAVGVMMAVVMGVSPDDADTLDRACDLGLAFQLANIARDLKEDDAAGRCYLPAEWLAEADIPPGQQLYPPHREALAGLAARLCAAALVHEQSARIGAARLGMQARWAILAAAGIYGGIARVVAARGARAWHSRAHVPTRAKLAHVLRAGMAALFRHVPTQAEAMARRRRFTRADLIAVARARPVSI